MSNSKLLQRPGSSTRPLSSKGGSPVYGPQSSPRPKSSRCVSPANAQVPSSASKAECIRVCVRCRPLSESEVSSGYERILTVDSAAARVTIKGIKANSEKKKFTFDAAFGEDSQQKDVYDLTAHQIVESAFNGFNGTVLVYGQTGTGKTYSMLGDPEPPSARGIIPNAFNHIFAKIASCHDRQFLVRVSYLEIYNEELRDLLRGQTGASASSGGHSPMSATACVFSPTEATSGSHALEIKEAPVSPSTGRSAGVYVKGLSTIIVRSVEEMNNALIMGNKRRAVAHTLMNACSSRSHAIFTITLESTDRAVNPAADAATHDAPASSPSPSTASPLSSTSPSTSGHILASRLHLVDLAGSERQSKTGASGVQLREAAKINLSLSALGNCISALVDGKATHIPYRDSKLTRLLQDSLGGNSKTLMLATLSPASYNFDETLSTLRYANRAKNIKNKPIVNEDPTDALLRSYQSEIEYLKNLIQLRTASANTLKENKTEGEKPQALSLETNGKKSATKSKRQTAGRTRGKTRFADAATEKESKSSDETEPEENDQVDSPTNAEIERLQAELDLERELLMVSSDLADQEKSRLVGDIEARLSALADERLQKELLESRLNSLQQKFVSSGPEDNLEKLVSKQEAELEEQRAARLAELKRQKELQEALEAQQEINLAREEQYATLQEEIDAKSRKIQKLWKKIDAAKHEIDDINDEWINERSELLTTVRDLVRDRDLRALILDNFARESSVKRLDNCLRFDEDKDQWIVVNNNTDDKERTSSSKTNGLPDLAMACGMRPTCFASALMATKKRSMRLAAENILEVPLLGPDDSTREVITREFVAFRS